jgi:hypothetical protein
MASDSLKKEEERIFEFECGVLTILTILGS